MYAGAAREAHWPGSGNAPSRLQPKVLGMPERDDETSARPLPRPPAGAQTCATRWWTSSRPVRDPRWGASEWTKEVLLRLESLAHIDEHIQITEQTEGLYDEISAKAPHLATKIDALRDEHPVLRERATACQPTPDDPGRTRQPLREAEDDVQRLLGRSCAIASSDRIWSGRPTTSTSAGSSSSASV